MSGKIIKFEKTDDWYIDQSENWIQRGDAIKSLLYIGLAKGNGKKVMLRKAAAYYESGNFTPALRILTEMYRAGEHCGELYALLAKTLTAMSRFRSAVYFLNDAAEKGVFGFGEKRKITSITEFYRIMNDIKKRYPDYRIVGEVADLLYLVERGVDGSDETLIGDMLMNGKDMACSEMLFKATGVFSQAIDPVLADKLLGACENNRMSENGMPRYDVLSAEIIALASLGRMDEASMRADDLLNFDLPEDDVNLLKCSEAFVIVRCHEGVREYLDEFVSFFPNKTVLLNSALANTALGDYYTARDELARLLCMYPEDVNARRLIRALPEPEKAQNKGELPDEKEIVYSDRLPAENESEMSLRIEKMINFAEMRDGVPENADMKHDLLYVMTYADDEYADYVCEELVRVGMYKGLLKDYLIDIEGALERKRAILYAFCLYESGKESDLEIYVYGYKKAALPPAPFAKADKELIRAYYYAYATYSVYGASVPEDVQTLIASGVGALKDYKNDKNFVANVTAAIVDAYGMESVFGDMQSKGITLYANVKKTEKYVKILEEFRRLNGE